jgi:hypothetical protein
MGNVSVPKRVQNRAYFLVFSSLLAFLTLCAAPRAHGQNRTPSPGKGRTKEMGLTNKPRDHVLLLCSATVGNDTIYLSNAVWYSSSLNSQEANDDFGEFITKNYGPAHAPTCVRGPDDPATFEGYRQLKLDQYRKMNVHRHPPLRIVDVNWTPPAAPASAVATAPALTPTPAKPTQMSYEQALAARRPRTVTQEQLAAAAKTVTPPAHRNRPSEPAPTTATPTVDKYTFCYSTGSPYRGTAQSHYYVTGVFPASANAHFDGDFGSYLQQQHPQESHHAKCVPPGPMSTAGRTRSSFIEGQRKSFPNRAIVELPWKPTS